MGKRRHAAKTGDKKLYSSRNARKETSERNSQDIDSFYRGREESFLALESYKPSSDDDDDEQFNIRQNVLDLALGDGDNIEESDDSSGGEAQNEHSIARSAPSIAGSTSVDSVDNDDETQSLDQFDARQWGRKKSAYYDGDLGDLELGVQAEDDAFVEEEAARAVQVSRWNEMQEDDFVPSDDDEAADESTLVPNQVATFTDTSQLSGKERLKLLKARHPELLPVASHFSEILREYLRTTKVATDALIGKELDEETAKCVGASRQGQQFLLTKSLIELSAVLNTVLYLLLKSSVSKQDDPETAMHITRHPVMLQLKRSNTTMDTFLNTVLKSVDGMEDQMRHLVHAASLVSESNECDGRDDHVDFEQVTVQRDHTGGNDYDQKSLNESVLPREHVVKAHDDAFLSCVLEDARFGLRQHEVLENTRNLKRRKAPMFLDIGVETEGARNPKALSSVVNAIDQRARKQNKRSHDRPVSEGDDYCNDDIAAGVRMMEAELEGDGEGTKNSENREDVSVRQNAEELDATDFYGQMACEAKKKIQLKKEHHMVAPKFPTFEGEVEGERAISREMLKNRGLVPHKKSSNRNPRLKNRIRYRAALGRRKGAVREIRTDAGRYEGEGTGIKSTISRSRKLIS